MSENQNNSKEEPKKPNKQDQPQNNNDKANRSIRTTQEQEKTSWLFTPINSASLALFRIIFGLFYARYFYNLYASGWLQTNFAPAVYHFPWLFFEWIPQFSTPAIYWIWGVTIVAIGLFIVGFWFRGKKRRAEQSRTSSFTRPSPSTLSFFLFVSFSF
jgi:hypothetical protein